MGNVVQCFRTLLHYFKCKDIQIQSEAERSPLLSSEDSECSSPSLLDESEDDLLTASPAETNPSLVPENFLFPDIILSSSLGGEVTLVEPMVCLLVSEEEEGRCEGQWLDEPGDSEQRRKMGRNRGFSEVETQTEMETEIGMEVETQTESQAEVQTQTEMLFPSDETLERDVMMGSSSWAPEEADANVQTSPECGNERIRPNSAGWTDAEMFTESENTESITMSFIDIHESEAEQDLREEHHHEQKHGNELNTELREMLHTDGAKVSQK